MTLLTIVQDAWSELGLSSTTPSTVIGNSDQNVTRLLALANRGGKVLAQHYAWTGLIREATFVTIADEDQGAIETIAPGFNWDIYETMWNRSTINYTAGPLFPKEWQNLKALTVSGPFPAHRIRNKHLFIIPEPTAGDTIAFEYVSRYFCESSTGTGQERWVADTDVGTLNEDWLTMDLVWRFKRAVGLDYGEERLEFDTVITNAMARDGGKRPLSLGEKKESDIGGLYIPAGNWNL